MADMPKAFLLTNVVLTGLPLLLFLTFSMSIFVSSLFVCLLLGLAAALLFTASCVGLALLLLVPTVFVTTITSFFIFIWGLAGYFIFKWLNGQGAPGKSSYAASKEPKKLYDARSDGLLDSAWHRARADSVTNEDSKPAAVSMTLNGRSLENGVGVGSKTPDGKAGRDSDIGQSHALDNVVARETEEEIARTLDDAASNPEGRPTDQLPT